MNRRLIENASQCWRSPWKVTEREQITLEENGEEVQVAGRAKKFVLLTPFEMRRAAMYGQVVMRPLTILAATHSWA